MPNSCFQYLPIVENAPPSTSPSPSGASGITPGFGGGTQPPHPGGPPKG